MDTQGSTGIAAFGEDAALLGLTEHFDPDEADWAEGAEGADGAARLVTGSSEAQVSLGARIRAARKTAGLTGEALGGMVGLTKDKISKIESGRRRVEATELLGIADAVGISVQVLMGVVAPQQSAALAMAARLAPNSGSVGDIEAQGQLDSAMAQRAAQILQYDDLLTRVAQMAPAVASPAGRQVVEVAADRDRFPRRPRNMTTAVTQGRDLARVCRRVLDLGNDGIGDLAALIEMHFAVDVAIAPLGTACDGLCAHTESAALLLATSSFPEGHVRFTLAHELGHHLLGDPRPVIAEGKEEMFASADTVERRVNAFAGYFLMPEDGLRNTLTWAGRTPGAPITSRHLAALMEHFDVSRQALMYQLRLSSELSWDFPTDLDKVSVRDLLAHNRDLAPTGRSNITYENLRPPQRLIRAARTAARSETLGLGVLAALLGRDDDDDLFDEVMGEPSLHDADDVDDAGAHTTSSALN